MDPAGVVRGDDLHWYHQIFVVLRGGDAEEGCDVSHDYVVAVVVAAAVVEGSMAEGEQWFDVPAGRSAGI